jgi:hypothetical protein
MALRSYLEVASLCIFVLRNSSILLELLLIIMNFLLTIYPLIRTLQLFLQSHLTTTRMTAKQLSKLTVFFFCTVLVSFVRIISFVVLFIIILITCSHQFKISMLRLTLKFLMIFAGYRSVQFMISAQLHSIDHLLHYLISFFPLFVRSLAVFSL